MLLQDAGKLRRWRPVMFNVTFCSGGTVTAASSTDDFAVLHTMLNFRLI